MHVREMSVEVGSDHHGFLITGMAPAIDVALPIPENTVLRWSDDGSDLASFLIATGSQWGPFAVHVQVHEVEPGPVDAVWEDVVAVSVRTTDTISIDETADGPRGHVPSDPGLHRMRVACRGRTESAARDDAIPDDESQGEGPVEAPLEHYLVELWPAPPAPAEVLRQASAYALQSTRAPVPDHPPEREAGLDAAWAIVRDLQGGSGARTLPGPPTTVTVAKELAGTPARLFDVVRHTYAWPPCHGSMGSLDGGTTHYFEATLPEYDDREDVGYIATTPVEATKPQQVVMRWNWVLPGRGPLAGLPLLLAEDSRVTITVSPMNGKAEEPRCLVRIVHDGAPGAWAHDLERLWRWHLALQASKA